MDFLKGAKQCEAKAKRTGQRCKNPAIKGKKVCRLHGGKSLGGVLSPIFKHGRYSKALGLERSQTYEQALTRPELLSLYDDVALIEADIIEHLQKANTKADVHPAWLEVSKIADSLSSAIAKGDSELLIKSIEILKQLALPHYRATIARNEALSRIDQKARIADKERRIMLDTQRMISTERARAQMFFLIDSIRESLERYCDSETSNRILIDASTAFSRAIDDGSQRETKTRN